MTANKLRKIIIRHSLKIWKKSKIRSRLEKKEYEKKEKKQTWIETWIGTKKSKWKREMNVQTEKGNKSPNKDWKK